MPIQSLHAYVLDVDPTKSHPVADDTPRLCACGTTIIDTPGSFIRASQCAPCEHAFERELERQMIAHGHAGGWPLYLTTRPMLDRQGNERQAMLVNPFHGHVHWNVSMIRDGRHNIAGTQRTVYFRVGLHMWLGRVYGRNTQLVRSARRLATWNGKRQIAEIT